ncbi:MAG: hypothetical protein QOJ73_2630 [Streptosporangiaceae bacterium]|nr:hypothetical protein [Streptosporangiaceae bacterium]
MRIAVAGGSGMVGRYVVEAAGAAGHEPVILSRSSGVDLRSDVGLAAALDGVEVIIDTTNSGTINGAKATAFFTDVTRRLQAAGAAVGVARLVTLSIVGIDRIPGYGYYEAKLAQEEAAFAGPLPATAVRATQFHEFPAQVLSRSRLGPLAMMPVMQVQTIAARAVGQVLLDTAVAPPSAKVFEIAGPEPAGLVALARRVLHQRRRHALVVPLALPGAAARAMRSGALLPSKDARITGPTFTQWLNTADAQRPAF